MSEEDRMAIFDALAFAVVCYTDQQGHGLQLEPLFLPVELAHTIGCNLIEMALLAREREVELKGSGQVLNVATMAGPLRAHCWISTMASRILSLVWPWMGLAISTSQILLITPFAFFLLNVIFHRATDKFLKAIA